MWAAAGCGLPPLSAWGERVAVGTDRDGALCAGTALHLDRTLESIASRFETPLPSGVNTRYFVVADVSAYCSNGAGACAKKRGGKINVFSTIAVDAHELAHAVHLLSRSKSSAHLTEGLAASVDSDLTQVWDAAFLDNQILESRDHTADHATRAFFVLKYVERYGWGSFWDLWSEVGPKASAKAFDEALNAQGVQRDEFVADTEGEVACGQPVCAGRVADGDGTTGWSVSASETCSDEFAVGHSADGEVDSYFTIEIPERGTYRIESVASGGWVSIQYCDVPCWSDKLLLQTEAFEGVLEAGSLNVQFSTPTGTPATLTIVPIP